MSHCVFCLNQLEENESLLVDECSVDNISATQLLKTHFDFSDKILETSLDPKCMCSKCWASLVSFHEWHTTVAINYGIVQVVQADVEEEQEAAVAEAVENPAATTEIIDDDNTMAYEEYIEEDVDLVQVETIEEGLIDECQLLEEQQIANTFEISEIELKTENNTVPYKMRGRGRSKFSEQSQESMNLPVANSGRRAPPTPKDPMDEEKIRTYANMNCDRCSKLLTSFADARSHYRNEHGMEGYLGCCDRTFKQRNRLLDHINVTHCNLTYQCNYCFKNFDSRGYLVRHMIYHTEEKNLFCDHCPKSFHKKFLLRNHLLAVHAIENLPPTFPCTVPGCTKVCVTINRLKHHLNYFHASKDTYRCEICTKGFKTKNAVVEHMLTHTQTKADRFKCNLCGHFIKTEKAFKRHLKNHETEALDNSCHYCGKKSPNANALAKHIKYVHEAERNYQCRFCDKSFKRMRTKVDHEASVHTMQELYSCKFCGKSFKNSTHMLAHRKKAHPDVYEKPHYMRDISEFEVKQDQSE